MSEETRTSEALADISPEALRAADAILNGILPRPMTTSVYVARLIELHTNVGQLRDLLRRVEEQSESTGPRCEPITGKLYREISEALAAPGRTEPQ